MIYISYTDMIVSGLPTRNGDQHAGEVCTTAMDLLHAIESFEIRHMKSTKLQLRIGIHTGKLEIFFSCSISTLILLCSKR